ncbi:DoxX family membrane protein [Flexivirga oryzae]|uniref:Putative membrane protein YphA (DoxX/SURF4 family) n=1 Tax=Flexivirga oryzae TaxID=1794944 RepID=A0A839N6R7_9MICO|nr:DoxX family membrane protein [Flexivirga oryzae]MBB2893448.1 putative membrane protein YphA (DoxX/SURF4 family) [Flexivirga oryzae]
MRSLRVLARLMTGTTYAILGADAAREPGARVAQAAPLLDTLRSFGAPLPQDNTVVVRLNGAAQAAAGAALAAGVLRRPAAAVLLCSLIPTTVAGHAFWAVEDPTARKLQGVQFLKNVAMAGGLLFAVLDSPSRSGVTC